VELGAQNPNYVKNIPQRHDRRTDRQTTCNLITALCVASRGNKIESTSSITKQLFLINKFCQIHNVNSTRVPIGKEKDDKKKLKAGEKPVADKTGAGVKQSDKADSKAAASSRSSKTAASSTAGKSSKTAASSKSSKRSASATSKSSKSKSAPAKASAGIRSKKPKK